MVKFLSPHSQQDNHKDAYHIKHLPNQLQSGLVQRKITLLPIPSTSSSHREHQTHRTHPPPPLTTSSTTLYYPCNAHILNKPAPSTSPHKIPSCPLHAQEKKHPKIEFTLRTAMTCHDTITRPDQTSPHQAHTPNPGTMIDNHRSQNGIPPHSRANARIYPSRDI